MNGLIITISIVASVGILGSVAQELHLKKSNKKTYKVVIEGLIMGISGVLLIFLLFTFLPQALKWIYDGTNLTIFGHKKNSFESGLSLIIKGLNVFAIIGVARIYIKPYLDKKPKRK